MIIGLMTYSLLNPLKKLSIVWLYWLVNVSERKQREEKEIEQRLNKLQVENCMPI